MTKKPLYVLILLFASLFFSAQLAAAQAFPPYAVNTWTSLDPQGSRIITFYSDGSYVIYWTHNSTVDITDQDCTSQVLVSRGYASISGNNVNFSQFDSFGVHYQSCIHDGENATVEALSPDPIVLPIELRPNTTHMTLGQLSYIPRFFTARTFQSLPITALAGHWKAFPTGSTISKLDDLIIESDGTYREVSIVGDIYNVCRAVTTTQGNYYVDGMVLTLEPTNGEATDCNGNPTNPNLSEKKYTIWLVNDTVSGYTLYRNGVEFTQGDNVPALQN